MTGATQTASIQFELPGKQLTAQDKQDAAEIKEWLENNGGSEVLLTDNTEKLGLAPLIPIVIAVAIGAAALAKLVTFVWEKFQYEQIVSYHDGKVTTQIVKIRNGEVLIFADKDTVVQIDNPKDPIDLTEVAKAALGDAVAGAKAAADGGSKATVASPGDDKTKAVLKLIADKK